MCSMSVSSFAASRSSSQIPAPCQTSHLSVARLCVDQTTAMSPVLQLSGLFPESTESTESTESVTFRETGVTIVPTGAGGHLHTASM
uniref:Uncharacterized protein n=1 Tax=Knipowitschia caucasica TaxID=637954 RepID=A0AAV2JP83_KNICA